MKYAELFAGLGIGSMAIKAVFPDAKCAFYSEIEKNRCALLAKSHDGAKNIGDVDFADTDNLPSFELLIGGSPCQDLSIARSKREGLDGHESGLFYKYLEILQDKKPKYFILENVNSMPESEKDEISRCLGVKPVMIDSSYFTGQARERLYWCNFPMLPIPTEVVDPRHCIDKSVVPDEVGHLVWEKLYNTYYQGEKKAKTFLKRYKSDWDFVSWSRSTRTPEFDTKDEAEAYAELKTLHEFKIGPGKKKDWRLTYVEQRCSINMRANTLLTGKHCSIFSAKNFVRHGSKARPLTVLECARLQGFPDGMFDGWKDNAAYSAIGDAFTLPVIIHIMKSLKAHIETKI